MWDPEILGRLHDKVEGKLQGAEGERRERLLRLLAHIEKRLRIAERLHWDGRQ